MKKIILSIALFTLIGAGCASSAPSEYKVNVIKSPVLKNTLTLKATRPINVKELMYQAGSKFESRINISNNEVVTQLDGVISTASKQWNLYINDKKTDFVALNKVMVKPGDKIEWKYEPTK